MRFTSNPAGPTTFFESGPFFAVRLAFGHTFKSLLLLNCDLAGGTQAYWWNGSAWLAVTARSYDPGSGCLTLAIDDSSTPNLAQVNGSIFGVGSGLRPPPSPSPAPSPSPGPAPSPQPVLFVPPLPPAQGQVDVARAGNTVTLTATPASGHFFLGWQMTTGVQAQAFRVGDRWTNPLILDLVADTTVTATFVARPSFNDVPGGRADTEAILQLAARGLILGYGGGRFGPDDGVSRAQMAALIARAMARTTGDPAHILTPPACIVPDSWDCEDWGNAFADRNGLDGNLWRNIGTLRHYGVAYGLDGVNFAPNAPVTYAQTISFITRAMKAKGYWQDQSSTPTPYTGVPGPHAGDVATFYYYTRAYGGVPASPGDWNAQATRGWFARALWQALDSTFGH
jgi:hypothetical protein